MSSVYIPRSIYNMRYFNIYLLSIISFALYSCSSEPARKLPILGTREPVEKTVNGQLVVDTIYQTIPDFNFLNQDSVSVTNKDFDGKIYVADFFFTSCPSICPIMHRNLLKIYDEFKDNKDVKLVSHTIDFKYDTPSKLKRYADKLGVAGTQWEFLNGPQEQVYQIAEKNYLVAVGVDKDSPGGYIHQGWMILVDKEKRLRGAYDGTDEKQMAQLSEDMKTLLEEYKN